jgi:hypothetical protein
MWADGPRRGEVVILRDRHVVIDEHDGLDWRRHGYDDPSRPVETQRTVWSVFGYRVGDRMWRMLVPEYRNETMILLTLIDAEPALLREVEVSG